MTFQPQFIITFQFGFNSLLARSFDLPQSSNWLSPTWQSQERLKPQSKVNAGRTHSNYDYSLTQTLKLNENSVELALKRSPSLNFSFFTLSFIYVNKLTDDSIGWTFKSGFWVLFISMLLTLTPGINQISKKLQTTPWFHSTYEESK